MERAIKRWALLAAGLAVSAGAWAAAADDVTVQEPYVRLAPPNAPATGAFMVIRNNGGQDVKVVKADNPASRATELHAHLNDNGVMRMRPVADIDIKAKGEVALKPGGLHIMMIDLKAPLKEGELVPITLGFADGSSKKVEARVVRPGAAMPAMEHKMEHKH